MADSTRPDNTEAPDQPSTLRCIVAVLKENFALLVAGSLAYSAFMSIVPLITLSLVVAAALGDQQFTNTAMELIAQYAPASLGTLFLQAMQNTAGRAAISFVSLLVIVWSALRVFRTLDTSFSMFYNTTGVDGIVDRTRDALLVVGSFGVALAATVGLGAAASFLSGLPLNGLLAPVVLVVPLFLAFLPIYYVFPDTGVTVREVLPGVLIAAVGWAGLQVGFQLYVTYWSQSQVYGTLGAVLLALTWLYLAGLVLLVGVAVNVVLADRTSGALTPPQSRTDVTVRE